MITSYSAKKISGTNDGLLLVHVYDAGPTLNRHWNNVLCLLAIFQQSESRVVFTSLVLVT